MVDTYAINSFDWDRGNRQKNNDKHQVTIAECEGVFFNRPLYIFPDIEHSQDEDRLYCLGKTNQDRPLFIYFTIRETSIRIISARDMSRTERKQYEK